MAENFYTILTSIGQAKIANSQVTGQKVNLAEIAAGDGNGSYYNPVQSQTGLRKEVWRGNISAVQIDEENPNWIVIEGVIPSSAGGFFVREVGVFDEEGDLIAIGKYPETYKPVAAEGSAKDLYIRMIIEVTNASAVQLKIDPSVIIASRKYVDDKVAPVEQKANQNATSIQQLQQQVNEHLNDKLQDGVHGLATTQNMTLYVDGTNGDDSNDGLTPQTAFKSIQKAVDSVPKILRHPVTINIADGVYDDSVFVCGFRSEPSVPGVDFNLEIIGNNDDATAVKLNSIYFESNVSGVLLKKVEILNLITCRHNVAVSIDSIVSKEPTERALSVSFSSVRIENSEISNKTRAIFAYNGSFVHSYNNTGTGNSTCFYSSEGSVIVKNGSQPQGDEETWAGGIVVGGSEVKYRHDLTLLGRKINIETPASTSGWSRGVFYYQQGSPREDEYIIGGIGAFGPTGNVLTHLYMGTGPLPWNNKGLRVKADGSVVIYDGTAERTVWHAGNAGPFYRGTGSPEGVVTAPPGSLYQNLSGGQGTTLYYKASGTGNTGWRAVA